MTTIGDVSETPEKLEREIRFQPAFDKRTDNPKTNYGIHGVQMAWYLKGVKGIIQFIVYTNWQLPHVQAEQDAKPVDRQFPHLLCRPMGADIGYHAVFPQYEGSRKRDCHLLAEKECYYDGSGMNAERIFNILVRDGDEAVWAEMQDYYNNLKVGAPQ